LQDTCDLRLKLRAKPSPHSWQK
jgi:hypothetical protein